MMTYFSILWFAQRLTHEMNFFSFSREYFLTENSEGVQIRLGKWCNNKKIFIFTSKKTRIS